MRNRQEENRRDERRREEQRREDKRREERKREERRTGEPTRHEKKFEKWSKHSYLIVYGLFLLLFSCSAIPSIYSNISENNLEAIKKEINSGTDVNIKSKYGSPLYYAMSLGRWEIAKYLLKNGANVTCVNPKSGFTPLTFAAAWGNTEMVRLLLENGADVNTIDKLGYSILMHACSPKATIECLDELIENGADINYSKTFNEGNDEYPADLLVISAMENRQDLINYFKKKGLVSKAEYPVVCIGYGAISLPQFENDWRFNGKSGYAGKWTHRLSFIEIDSEPWTENINMRIGEVFPGQHNLVVRYFTSSGYTLEQKSATTSKPITVSVDCRPNIINVLNPVLSSENVSIKIRGYKIR